MSYAAPSSLTPRFPRVAMCAGHYESFYLTATNPRERTAVWIRYTVHKAPGRQATGSIWFTVFDPDGPTAVKVTIAEPHTDVDGRGQLLVVGEHGEIRSDGARGVVSGHGVTASWDLRFEPVAGELRHLPYAWMYSAPLPRTKSTSPFPSMLVSGTVTVDGRTFTVQSWPGMLGHNWGSEHAHRWIWLRGALFVDHPDAWLDVVIGQIKVGSRVLPWIANGAIALQGNADSRHRIGGLGRRISVVERPDGCDLVLPGRDVSLTAHVDAPLRASVGWEYADPAGGRHQVRNCSIAALEVQVQHHRSDAGVQQLRTAHGCVYELGRAEFDQALVVQPYQDG